MNNPLDGARTDRRRFLGLVGFGAIAMAAGGGVAGCGSTKSSSGPGTTNQSELQKLLPAFVQTSSIKPDIPGTAGANGFTSDPVFLSYPASPVQTVTGVPGKGGSYSTITPLWGAIPPSSGNTYYDTVNQALGAKLKIQPSDGNSYQNMLPTLFAASKLPDWIQIPSWNMTTLGFSDAVVKFTDLGPYLSGDKIKAYPNLAAIPSSAWQACIWNGKLYGLPVYPSGANIAGTYFYRKDIFAKLGINADSIKTPDDLAALGAQLTSASAGQWAFDDLWPYLGQPFKYPDGWGIDASGKIYHKYESQAMIDALQWQAKLVAAGHVHPDAIAGNSQNAKQRFWSGKVAVTADGPGAWNGDDAKSGTAANASYNRQAFKLLSVDGTPVINMSAGTRMYSFLNAKLTADQVKECLSIANYLAAPYGSKEWLVVNFGAAGTDYTMVNGNPALTELGGKQVATTFPFLVTPITPTTVSSGFTEVAKDYGAWQADMVKYSVKPAFYAMNITEPVQYAKIGQAVEDILIDVRFGRKPISAFQDAVKTWQSQGGNALRAFYEDIRTKNGTGQ